MSRRSPLLLLTLFLAGVLLVSGIQPKDRLTWLLEVAPILILLPILWAVRHRFPLTPLLTLLIGIHGLILAVGGHYTYAEVPLGFWAEAVFGFTRNHYDRLGHIAQGFVPAIAVREVLLRNSPLRQGKWLFFLVSATCLAISAVYEFVEWGAALLSAEASEAFLGTQGDVWDTQWDMFLALCGSILAQAVLARLHDRQLARLPTRS